MNPETHTVREIFKEGVQWIVPVYQREYEWGSKDPDRSDDSQVVTLWKDVRDKALNKIEGRTEIPHYFGAIICARSDVHEQRKGGDWSKESERKIRKYHIIDGQQRITSSQLMLMALKEVANSKGLRPMQKDIDVYVFNGLDKEGGARRRENLKIVPSRRDRKIYDAMATKSFATFREELWRDRFKGGKPAKDAENLIHAYWTLQEKINDFIKERGGEGDSAEKVLKTLFEEFLDGFRFVMISLDEEDDAQGIFASLNGLSKPLSSFDLIRNAVFLRARDEGIDQDDLYDDHWSFFNEDEDFWRREERRGRMKARHQEHFMGHAVIAETGRNINISGIATEYNRYVADRQFSSVKEELDLLRRHAENYRCLEQYKSRESDLADIAGVLDRWDVSSFHPLIMWTCSREHISEGERKSIFDLIEAYLVRREICSLRTNYNQVVPPMIHSMIDADKGEGNLSALRALQKHMAQLKGNTRKMPDDNAVREAFGGSLLLKDYRPRLWRWIFLQIEYEKRHRFNEKAEVEDDGLQVEHVMPLSWAEIGLCPMARLFLSSPFMISRRRIFPQM